MLNGYSLLLLCSRSIMMIQLAPLVLLQCTTVLTTLMGVRIRVILSPISFT